MLFNNWFWIRETSTVAIDVVATNGWSEPSVPSGMARRSDRWQKIGFCYCARYPVSGIMRSSEERSATPRHHSSSLWCNACMYSTHLCTTSTYPRHDLNSTLASHTNLFHSLCGRHHLSLRQLFQPNVSILAEWRSCCVSKLRLTSFHCVVSLSTLS